MHGKRFDVKYIGRIQDDRLLEAEEKIVIYGCGTTGRQVYKELQKRGLGSQIYAFCDGDLRQAGKQIEGIPILSVEEATKKYGEAAFLVASCCVRDMVTTLQQNHVDNIHITRA